MIGAPEDALGVDDEEPAERDALVLEQDAVVARDLHALVRHERELQIGSEPACLARLGRPREVRELGVGGDAWRQNECRCARAGCGDAPRTTVLISFRAGRASLNARISVGQTKVKSLRRSFVSPPQ